MKNQIKALQINRAKKHELLQILYKLREEEKYLSLDVLHEKFACIMEMKPQQIKISGRSIRYMTKHIDDASDKTLDKYEKLCHNFENALDELRSYYKSEEHAIFIPKLLYTAKNNEHLMRRIVANNFDIDKHEHWLKEQ